MPSPTWWAAERVEAATYYFEKTENRIVRKVFRSNVYKQVMFSCEFLLKL